MDCQLPSTIKLQYWHELWFILARHRGVDKRKRQETGKRDTAVGVLGMYPQREGRK